MGDPLHIFDPRRNLQLQGFSGRGATTTLHDATETGVSISGIFQAAEDFAVLGWWNAYDYFNHLRLKHLPKTDLSGLKLEFDIEYDNKLDGAMRFDAAKYPSVAWDVMTFVTGAGDIHEVRLLDHATVVAGGETAASVRIHISGDENMDGGIDWLHLYFRDTRYTVTSTDCRVETQLTADVNAGDASLPVQSTAGFSAADGIWIERTGTNEEQTTVAGVLTNALSASVSMGHPSGSFVTRKTKAWHVAQKLANIINAAGASVAGRFGPDQSGVIHAQAWADGPSTGGITITFILASGTASRFGKLGNLDRVFLAHGRTLGGVPVESGQGFQWSAGSGTSILFANGDNNTKYHVTLDFTQTLLDKNGAVVPMSDCRKMYMVFAARFENVEQDLQDGCFLNADVGASDSTLTVDDTSKLTGDRYFIGTPASEERVQLLAVHSPTQITVTRGFESSALSEWPTGARIKKLSPLSGFAGNVEWRCTISNITVTGDASLKVGGGSRRIDESDARCRYTGYWEKYSYGAAWPSQWWSGGHARRTTIGTVTIRYSYPRPHDLYLGTFLSTDCGEISVAVDGGAPTTHNHYLDEYGGTTANLKLRDGMAAGNHSVEIIATSGDYFYFDYLWPLEPQDVPDAPQEYSDVSLAIDFDTDHGYKKPPAWHVWQLQKLGFSGYADVYMGVFWNNKRRRINATYPYATVVFSGTPTAGDVVSFSIGGTTLNHAIGYGETLQGIVSQMRATINGLFSGVWADDNFGSSTTLRIQSKAPLWTYTGVAVSTPNSVMLTLTDHLGTAGVEGNWEMIDSVSPVMTEGARRWIRDLAGEFQAAGANASFAFSMDCYRPPAEMAACYWDGAPVDLPVPSTQMHFGARVRNYLRQMYKECADQIAVAGLPVILQFGETQWWYFPNDSGMPYYDAETQAAFEAAYGRPMHRFLSNTDDPADDQVTADFLRDRIWKYCLDVITYVRQYHPAAVFECLWPLDANRRALNLYVNLPNEWKNSSYGIKFFRCEGFDFDVWQKSAVRMRQTILYPHEVLGRPAAECIYLAGIYGPPDPPMAQAYGMWRAAKLYSMCFWAFDQFCLNSRPVPLESAGQVRYASYHKPRAARAVESAIAAPVVAVPGGALNRFEANRRKLNA